MGAQVVGAGRALPCLLIALACAKPNKFDPSDVVRPDALDASAEARTPAVSDARDAEIDAGSADILVDLGVDSPDDISASVDTSGVGPLCGNGAGQACCEGATRACSTACGMGLETCRGAVFSGCTAREPSAENCANAVDDDCDGMPDCRDTECLGKVCAAENVCSGGTCVASEAIFLFLSAQKYDGALGGRDGADAKCLSEVTSLGLNCKNARAFIGVSAPDSIANLAGAYSIPSGRPVLDLEGLIRYPNFQSLVSGETHRTIPIADFDTPIAPAWWSGAIDNGAVEANYTCRGWTSPGVGMCRRDRDEARPLLLQPLRLRSQLSVGLSLLVGLARSYKVQPFLEKSRNQVASM